MTDESAEQDQGKKILTAFDKAIEEGPWEKTLFLRVIGKKLKEIRARFVTAIGADPAVADIPRPGHLADRIAQRSGQLEVFISIYNAAGSDINSWERMLSNISRHIISRPILRAESEARELIRSKLNKRNEAYIAAYIDAKDVMRPIGDIVPKDALGHSLLVLRDGAVKPDHITRFMHSSGKYLLKEGKLIRQGDLEYMDFL